MKLSKTGYRFIWRYSEGLLSIVDINKAAQCVDKLLKVKLKQNEYDVVVSFCCSIGIEAFEDSSFLKHLNNNDFQKAMWWLLRWNVKNGKKDRKLIERRKLEKEIFLFN